MTPTKEATQHIINWMEKTADKYPFITFKYEYSEKEYAHTICTYPKKKINACDAYCDEQIAFNREMDKLFPDEPLLFSTGGWLFTCSENALEISRSSLVMQAD